MEEQVSLQGRVFWEMWFPGAGRRGFPARGRGADDVPELVVAGGGASLG